jgi:hypothetical protein
MQKLADGMDSGSTSTGSSGLDSGSSATGGTPSPLIPLRPTGPEGGWPEEKGRPSRPTYGGGGGGGSGGGVSEKAEFYLKNLAEDVHDILYIEKVKAQKSGDTGLLAEIDRLLGRESYLWTRTT